MAFVVTEPCVGCKYTDCVTVCPCDCFHEGEQMLYIDPAHCVDCEACAPECPVGSIFHEDSVPPQWRHCVALNALGAASGADRAVKQAIPIIDDFRFGSAYSTQTGKTEPQLTVGKRLTNDLRASVTAGLSEDRELRSNIEWRLSNRLSVQGSYDNINDVSSSTLGNLGMDLRWRLEFE